MCRGLIPYYTMQVYIDDNKIIGLGLIKTVELMQFIVNGHAEEKSSFYVCSWDDLCGKQGLMFRC